MQKKRTQKKGTGTTARLIGLGTLLLVALLMQNCGVI